VLPGADFFFSTEEVANLGDASLGVVERPTKERRQREAACSVRAVLAFFCFFGHVRRYQTAFSARRAVTKRLFRTGDPLPNGFFGRATRYQTAFSAHERLPNGRIGAMPADTKRLYRRPRQRNRSPDNFSYHDPVASGRSLA
jgi:hypothetical protein